MRCFLSIDLPQEIQKELEVAQSEIYSDDSKLLNVRPDKMHITLKFLGEIDEKQIEKVLNALSKIKIKKFKVKLSRLGVFPDERFIRVVWAGFEPTEKIIDIQKSLDHELHAVGFELEKGFENHATLARVKYVKDKKSFMDRMNKVKLQPLEFEVNEIHFKESILTPEGPIYSDIKKLKLN